MSDARFELTASPHLKRPVSTRRIMWTVTATLAPATLAAAWFFGLGALLVVGASILGAVVTERAMGGATLLDGSAVLTGLLLGLTLPAGFPLWMAFVGGFAAIAFGKLIFGGLGQNVFNPALLGRAFLQASFPVAITTWPEVGRAAPAIRGDLFAFPFTTPEVPDAVTAATPLGAMKFEGVATDVLPLLLGHTGGSLGETSALLLLAGGAYLAAKRYLDWRIPVAIFATVGLLSWGLAGIDASYPGPGFMLFSGGLVLGAVYMATDPVTSPVTPRGAWIFGAGIGVLVVLIRLWGGLPEGVMYAILLMNALVPFIGRATQPRVFGTVPEEEAA
ncbi:MAG: RnfABCDGE type electron transport complex subunit D [Gemmatimonadota bacterium]|nr:RnfABCDGE type electron transport complex subunit D [Gemmatimonadota bacterium]